MSVILPDYETRIIPLGAGASSNRCWRRAAKLMPSNLSTILIIRFLIEISTVFFFLFCALVVVALSEDWFAKAKTTATTATRQKGTATTTTRRRGTVCDECWAQCAAEDENDWFAIMPEAKANAKHEQWRRRETEAGSELCKLLAEFLFELCRLLF